MDASLFDSANALPAGAVAPALQPPFPGLAERLIEFLQNDTGTQSCNEGPGKPQGCLPEARRHRRTETGTLARLPRRDGGKIVDASLLGIENELLLVADDPALRPQLPGVALKLIEWLRNETVSLPCNEGAGSPPGLMLENGNRIYIDDNNYVENASAEVRTPEDLLLYQRAGELWLLQVLPKAAQAAGVAPGSVRLIRAVTDYAGHYCGQHINILVRRYGAAELVSCLVPFLLSRFYACAGGWGPTGFVMTQKAQAIQCVSSKDTRLNRGIVNLKEEPLAQQGYRRIHLTSSDATMSEWATYLTVGCTALVLKMLDDGVCVGPAMTLADPVAAAHSMDTDLTWTRPLPLACGAEASGLAIQAHYLRAAEVYCAKQHCEEWMHTVVARWRQTVDELRSAQGNLTRKLDPFIKMKLYSGMLAEQGLELRTFSHYCGAICFLQPHLGTEELPHRGLREFLRDRIPFVSFMLLEERMERHRLSWRDLRRAIGVWRTMLMTDLAFHDIGEGGVYWRLAASGAVNSRLTDSDALLRAMTDPPMGTRAQPRAEAIRELKAAEGGTARWEQVASAQRTKSFSNPFATVAAWKPVPQKTKRR